MDRPAPMVPPPPTPEQRDRAVRHWFDVLRPEFQASDKPPPDTPVQAKAKLRAMRPELSDDEFEAFFDTLGIFNETTTFDNLKGPTP
jgi:hypothetical protein